MLKKLKIKSRLLLCFLIIDLFMLFMTILGIMGLKNSLQNLNHLTRAIIPANTAILSCQVDTNAAAAKLGEMILSQDSSSYDTDVQRLREIMSSMEESMKTLDAIYVNSSTEQTNLIQYKELMSEWNVHVDLILDKLRQQDYHGAQELLKETIPTHQNILSLAMIMTRNIEEVRNQTADSSHRLTIQYSYLLLFLLISAAIISIVLTFRLTYSIVRPLNSIENAAKEMADGNLNIHINYQSSDELGQLADRMQVMSKRVSYYMHEITSSMKQLADGDLNVQKREPFLGDFLPAQIAIRAMVNSLNTTLTQIDQTADLVAGSSEQVSSGAQALSQGATEQASSVEQLAATMVEISQKVHENAQKAKLAKDTVNQVGTKLIESNQQMQDMTKAMDEITASSSQIGKIIKAIEDIAFQTNILALNAAVEAACAGASGKGFSVVAEEVRNLASKSSEASKSTSVLIESSLNSVRNGSRIAAETAASLFSVVEGTKEITEQINHIAEASSEQAAAATQISQGIDQISSVVQINSATAQESAAASEELSGQAQILKSLVDQFQLSDTERNAYNR